MRVREKEREILKKGEKDESEPATFSTPDRCDGARRGVEDQKARGSFPSPLPSSISPSICGVLERAATPPILRSMMKIEKKRRKFASREWKEASVDRTNGIVCCDGDRVI